jgi:hypothetical protein
MPAAGIKGSRTTFTLEGVARRAAHHEYLPAGARYRPKPIKH